MQTKRLGQTLWACGLLLWTGWLVRSYVVRASAPRLQSVDVELDLRSWRSGMLRGQIHAVGHRLQPDILPFREGGIRLTELSKRGGEAEASQAGLTLDYACRAEALKPRYEGDRPGLPQVLDGMELVPRLRTAWGGASGSMLVQAPEDADVAVFLKDRLHFYERGSKLDQPMDCKAADLRSSALAMGAAWNPPDTNTGGEEHRVFASGDVPAPTQELWGRALQILSEIIPPSDQAGGRYLWVLQSKDGPNYAEAEVGDQRLRSLAPHSPSSWEGFLAGIAADRLEARFGLAGEHAWLLAGIAGRSSVGCTSQLLGHSEVERWRDQYGRYVFLSSSREAPLVRFNELDGEWRMFLADLKAPLLVRALEEIANDGTVDWLAVLSDLERSGDLEACLRSHAGEASAEYYRRHVQGIGVLASSPFGDRLTLQWGSGEDEGFAPGHEASAIAQSFSLACTADTENYLETCGCKKLQAGGIARRSTVIRQRRQEHAVLALDLGNMAPRMETEEFDEVSRAETLLHLEAAAHMGYDGLALGPGELFLGPEFLMEARAAADLPWAAVNAQAVGDGPSPWETRGRRIFLETGDGDDPLALDLIPVTSGSPTWIRARSFERKVDYADLQTLEDAIARALQELPDSNGLVTVYGQIPPWRVPDLVDAFPEIDLIVSGDKRGVELGAGEFLGSPFFMSSGYYRDTLVVLSNERGHGLCLFSLGVSDEGRVVYYDERPVMLDSSVQEDPIVRTMLDEFYLGLGAAGLPSGQEPLFADMAAERDLVFGDGNAYVGSQACQDCHPSDYEAWKRTPHGGAFRTLTERHRDRSPACIICHSVGFGHPTGFSYAEPQRLSLLQDVGCETCHGPGLLHAQVRPGDPGAIRRSIGVQGCMQCHDEEHSEPLEPRLQEALEMAAHGRHGSSKQ